MHECFLQLLSTLQAELQEYGALLQLFDLQQACIVRHDPAGFLELNPQVEEQIEKLARCRVDREALIRQAAVECGRPEDSTLVALTPDCPPTRQPLLRALIEEINNLVVRTQRRMRQNCELLARCVEMARELVSVGNADAVPCTYGAHGEVSARINPDRFAPTLA
jgi:flagellar biosynthesis/type III secretory pathway chaperone